MRVLDAGCGYGRNLVYLLRAGIEVFAIDADPNAVLAVRTLAARSAPALPETHFKVETVEEMTIPIRHGCRHQQRRPPLRARR
jgi:2-polyprenyl-3-methyl-5-hydroxy-6-metoxy-1,4-benzoquinol methylase